MGGFQVSENEEILRHISQNCLLTFVWCGWKWRICMHSVCEKKGLLFVLIHFGQLVSCFGFINSFSLPLYFSCSFFNSPLYFFLSCNSPTRPDWWYPANILFNFLVLKIQRRKTETENIFIFLYYSLHETTLIVNWLCSTYKFVLIISTHHKHFLFQT